MEGPAISLLQAKPNRTEELVVRYTIRLDSFSRQHGKLLGSSFFSPLTLAIRKDLYKFDCEYTDVR